MFLISIAAMTYFNSTATEAKSDVELGDKLLGNGIVHTHVNELQELLNDRGYLNEKDKTDDGVFDVNTREAVISFQTDTDIYIDGVAGPQTVGALMVLREGDKGKVVLNLQKDLKQLGHYRSSLDGLFGPLTHQAVKDFQRDEDIAVDGLAGPQTYGTLHEVIRSNRGVKPSTNQSSSSEKTNNTEPVESDESDETPSSADIESSTETEVEEVEPEETNKEESDSTESTSDNNESNNSGGSSSSNGKVMTMEATAYTAYCQGCSGITYTGLDLRNNPHKKVIAVDPNVIPLGTKVFVEGYGEAIAGDIGGAIKGHKIDLFMPNREDALNFGRRNVEITVLE